MTTCSVDLKTLPEGMRKAILAEGATPETIRTKVLEYMRQLTEQRNQIPQRLKEQGYTSDEISEVLSEKDVESKEEESEASIWNSINREAASTQTLEDSQEEVSDVNAYDVATNKVIASLEADNNLTQKELEQFRKAVNSYTTEQGFWQYEDPRNPEKKAKLRQLANLYAKEIHTLYAKSINRGEEAKLLSKLRNTENSNLTDILGAVLNSTVKDAKQANERNKLVRSILDQIEGSSNIGSLTTSALRDIISYFNKHGNKTEYGVDSSALFLINKVDKDFFKAKASEYSEAVQGAEKMPFDNAAVAFQRRKQKARSLLGAIPGMRHILKTRELTGLILPKGMKLTSRLRSGIKDFNELIDKVDVAIHEKILAPFDRHIKDNPASLYRDAATHPGVYGRYIGQDFIGAPLHYLRDKNGRLDGNIVTAIAAELMTWIGTKGTRTAWNSPKDVAQLLNLDAAYKVQKPAIEQLTNAGIPRSVFIDEVGPMIARHLNIEMNAAETKSGYLQENLETSLGILALEVGNKLGLFEPQPVRINLKLFNSWRISRFDRDAIDRYNRETPDVDVTVPFLKVKVQKEDNAVIAADNVRELADSWNDVSKLFDKAFDINDRLRPVLTEEDKESSRTDELKERIRRTVSRVDPKTKESLTKLQNQPSEMDLGFKRLFEDFQEDDLKVHILGKKDPFLVHITEEDGQVGKNRTIDEDYTALKEAYTEIDISGKENQTIYFPYVVARNLRGMVDSNTLNYQTSKTLHRGAIVMPQWKETISKEDIQTYNQVIGSSSFDGLPRSLQRFYMAIAFVMDIKSKSPKLGIDKLVANGDTWKLIHDKMNEPLIRDALDTLTKHKNGTKFTTEEAKVLGAAVEGTGHGAWAVNALRNWVELEKAANSEQPFNHAFAMEGDGLSNGPAILSLQFVTDAEGAWRKLNRVGAFRKDQVDKEGNPITSFAQLKADQPDTLDNYETVGGGTQKYVNGVLNGDQVILSKIGSSDGRIGIYLPYLLRSLQGLFDAGVAQQKEIDYYFMKSMEDAGGNISDFARKFGKAPYMVKGYGAGASGIKGNIAVENDNRTAPAQLFYDKIMAIANSDASTEVKVEGIYNIVKLIKDAVAPISGVPYQTRTTNTDKAYLTEQAFKRQYVYDGSFEITKQGIATKYAKEAEERGVDPIWLFAKNYEIPREALQALENRFKSTYGTLAVQTLKDELAEQDVIRDAMMQGAKLINKIFTAIFETRRGQFMNFHKKAPSPSEQIQIAKELIDEGYSPSYRHPNSSGEGFADQLDIREMTTELMSKYDKRLRDQGKLTIPEDELNYESSLRIISGTEEVNPSTKKKRISITSQISREVPTGAASLRVITSGILGIESAAMLDSMEAFPGFTMFDAKMIGTNMMDGAFPDLNKRFVELNQSYSLVEAITEAVNRVTELYNNNPNDFSNRDREIIESNGPVDEPLTVEQLVAQLNDFQERVKRARDTIFSNLGAVNQYSLDGLHHQHNPPEAPTGLPELGSGPESPTAQEDWEIRYSSPSQATNVRTIMDDLANLETTTISPEHQNQLEEVIGTVILPGAGHLDNMNLELAVNPDGSINKGKIFGNEITIEAAGNRLSSPIDMSLQETYVHELLHAVLYEFVEGSNYWARNELQKIFDRAKDHITWEHFLPDWKEGDSTDEYSQYEIDAAKGRHDYIFNNPDGNQLHEFAAIGLSNEQFAKALATIPDKPSKSLKKELKDVDAWKSGPVQQLWNVLLKAVDWLMSIPYKDKKGNLHKSLLSLSQKMMTINAKQTKTISAKIDDRWNKLGKWRNKIIRKGIYRGVETLAGAYDAPMEIQSKKQADFLLKKVKTKLLRPIGKGMKKTFKEMAKESGWKIPQEGFIRDLQQELTGLIMEGGLDWRLLKLRGQTDVEVERKRIEDVMTKMVTDAFDPKKAPSKREWRALNDVFLRGDLVSLLGSFSLEKIGEFLTNDESLDKAIISKEIRLREQYGRAANVYIAQSKGLSSITAVGSTEGYPVPNQRSNAYEIANLLSVAEDQRRNLPEDVEEAEAQVDELISLYILKDTDPKLKKTAAKVFKHEMARGDANGITNMLNMHQHFKEESLEQNFSGSKLGTMKGYTKEHYDPDIQIEFAPVDKNTVKEMKRKGFSLKKTLARDPIHQKILHNKEPMGLYVSDIPLGRYNAQVVQMTNPQSRGTDIIQSLQQTNELYSNALGMEYIGTISMRAEKAALRQFEPDYDPRKDPDFSLLVPTVSQTDGRPVNYRYMMSEKDKLDILKRDDQAHQTLGRMFSNIHNKNATAVVNKAVIDMLHDEYSKAPYEVKQKLVKIGAASQDQQNLDAWRLLPEDMRNYAYEKFGEKAIYVRPELRNYILGFRPETIPQYLLKYTNKKKIKLPKLVLNSLGTADKIWRDLIIFLRQRSSILLPNVVFTNEISNNMLLLADGIPPGYIAKHSAEGIHAIYNYLKLDRKRLELETRINMSPSDSPEATRELRNINQQLDANPAKEMIKAGLFQTIVEDINTESLGGSGFLQEKFENLIEKLPNSDSQAVKWGTGTAKNVMMLPGSKTFQMALLANQLGDGVARYVKYKHDTEVKKLSKKAAIDESLDYFIFYDEPTSPILHSANDYGFIMFHKFYVRIQRVIWKLLRKKPANLATMHLLDAYTLGGEGITSYAVPIEKAWNSTSIIPFFRDWNMFPLLNWTGLVL